MAKDHTDYAARVKPLKRHLPDRLVGESTGNTMDARGDESLYKPSRLGRARCSLRSVLAGEDQPFHLEYEAGEQGLPTGYAVRFWMAGQGSLGTAPQVDEPAQPGFVEYTLPEGVRTQPICDTTRVLSLVDGENPKRQRQAGDLVVGPISIGFQLTAGCLVKGDVVRMDVGAAAGFTWKKLAGRKEFKVLIEPNDDSPKMRLPEPLCIDIEPQGPDHLDVMINGTAAAGEPVRGRVRVSDGYDNRVTASGPVQVTAGQEEMTVHLLDGRGTFAVTKDTGPLQVRARCLQMPALPEALSNTTTDLRGGRRLFFGDMHTHDSNSTAEGYPADCYQWARDEKRLDFQALAVQVHRWIDNEKWFLTKHMTEYFLDEGRFVTFLSFEWQHSDCGDKIVHYLGNDMPFLPVDLPEYDSPKKLYAALRKTDAFVISHHPGYALGLHVPGTRWESMEPDVDRLVELWSMHGSSEGYDDRDRPLIPPRRTAGAYGALRQGHRFGFVAGSDTHTARPGGSCDDVRPYHGGLCGVWATDLSRRSLFDAFQARHTYALTGARINLHFSVNGALMGSEIPFQDRAEICIDVAGTGPLARVEIMKNTEIHKVYCPSGTSTVIELTDDLAAPCFYHCRVSQTDGHVAVCSPVWVG